MAFWQGLFEIFSDVLGSLCRVTLETVRGLRQNRDATSAYWLQRNVMLFGKHSGYHESLTWNVHVKYLLGKVGKRIQVCLAVLGGALVCI